MADSTERDIDLREFLSILRRRWKAVALTVLIAVALAEASSALQTKEYRASAELLLQPRASERVFSPRQDTPQTDRQAEISTEIQVMKSRSIRSAVTEVLGHSPRVSIGPRGTTDVVAITATANDPAVAAREANAYADAYLKTRRRQAIDDLLSVATELQSKISEIDSQLAAIDANPDPAVAAQRQALFTERSTYSQQLSQLQLASRLTESGGAQLVSRAQTPSSPFKPAPIRNGVLALGFGLLAGVGIAFLREFLDDSLRSAEDVARITNLPILASIPQVRSWRDRKRAVLVTHTDAHSGAAEGYRSLRNAIQFLSIDHPMRTLQVTSAAAGEGKTTAVSNLAVAMAKLEKRILVVCCDFRRARLHEFFGVEHEVGFADVLVGAAALSDTIRPVAEVPHLWILPSGAMPSNPSELLASSRTQEAFDTLAREWDMVIVDSPPVLPVSDAAVLAPMVDATLLVVAADRSSRRNVRRAVEQLTLVEAPMVGAALNLAEAQSAYTYYARDEADQNRTPQTEEAGRGSSRRRDGLRRAERAAR